MTRLARRSPNDRRRSCALAYFTFPVLGCYGKLVMPGALTPTEVLTGWESGADIVKVFPSDVGGPAYLKALAGPLPQVRLLPTGGVNLETAAAF